MTKRMRFFAVIMIWSIPFVSAIYANTKSISSLNDVFDQKEFIYVIGDSTEKDKLEQLSIDWMDAMILHDTATLRYLMAPEYKLQSWDGKQSVYLSTWLDNLLHHITIVKFEQSGIYAEVHGDVALVTSMYSWSGTFNNNPFDSNGYIVDTWVRNNNHWQVISRTNGTFAGSKTLDSK